MTNPSLLPKLRLVHTSALEIAQLLQSAHPGTIEHMVALKAGSFATEAGYLLERESLPEMPPVPQRIQPRLGVILRSAYRKGRYRTLAGFGDHIWLCSVDGWGWAPVRFGVRASRAYRAYQAARAYHSSRYLNRKDQDPETRVTVANRVVSILRVIPD